MPMLAFLPWLNIKAPIVQGPFHLFPQGVGDVPPDGVDSQVSAETIGKVLSQYRESAKFPLRVVTVLQYDGRPLGADFDEADRAAIFLFGQHLAVSGLSDRRFIGGLLDGYTASGHYQMVIQAFTEPYSGSVSLTHRRKDGRSNVMLGQSDVHFIRPAHLVSQGEPNINLPLLAALQAVQTLPQAVHEHVDASVAYFSDRGRSDQIDRGRRFSVIVDARGERASEGFTVSQSSTISLKRWSAKRLIGVLGADLSTAAGVACDERTTRWVSRVRR